MNITGQHLQDMIDGMSARLQKERSASQMTLGELIERLEAMPPLNMVDKLESPHSYRGYYSDLAFERGESKMMATELLAIAKECMGKEFEGYKGGEFLMGQSTPVWISNYGTASGAKLMEIVDDGTIITIDEV